jgi:hypothetical protein
MALVELDEFPRLCKSITAIRYIYKGVRGPRAYLKVDLMSRMRTPSNPGIVSAYFYIYGHTGEGYGFASILELLRLLFPGLCTPN